MKSTPLLPLLLPFLLAASTVSAAPAITSVTPSQGPVTGGTEVTIKGSGFSDPARVFFNTMEAASVRVVDATTLVVVTPLSFPGPSSVFISMPANSASATDAFTFTGQISDAWDRLLLPIFIGGQLRGAFGSEFVTRFSYWNAADSETTVFGFPIGCNTLCPVSEDLPVTLPSRPVAATALEPIEQADHPGRFLYVQKGHGDQFAATLRVQDITRQAQTWGSTIPVVPEREFRSSLVSLLDIPIEGSAFRNTLRVYGDAPGTVRVRIVSPSGADGTTTLALTAGRGRYEAPYASLGNFFLLLPATAFGPLRVEVEPVTPDLKIWAFLGVTNNETQHITVITPR